jgi:hypothetical protein
MSGPRGGRGGTGGTGGRGGGIGGEAGSPGGRGEVGGRGERGQRGKGAFGWSQAFVYLVVFAAIAFFVVTNRSENAKRDHQFCTVTAYQYAQQDRQYTQTLEVLRSPLKKDPAQKGLVAYIRNVSLPRLKDDILRRPDLPGDCTDERLKLRPIPIVVDDLRKERKRQKDRAGSRGNRHASTDNAPGQNETYSKNRKSGGEPSNPPPGNSQPPPAPDNSGGAGGQAAPEIQIGPIQIDLPDLPRISVP